MSVGKHEGPDAFAHLVSARYRARQKLLGHLMTARDDERQRIASELHGDPLRSIAAVATKLEGLRDRLDDVQMCDEVRELERSVEETLSQIRRLTYDLSVSIGEEPLELALETRLRSLTERHAIAYGIDARIEREPSPGTRLPLLRILDEVFANVGAHAQATTIEVSVEAERGVLVRVEDDGVGFDPDEVGAGPGRMGLCLARQRAEAAGGWLRVESAPGKGTVVELFVPGC